MSVTNTIMLQMCTNQTKLAKQDASRFSVTDLYFSVDDGRRSLISMRILTDRIPLCV